MVLSYLLGCVIVHAHLYPSWHLHCTVCPMLSHFEYIHCWACPGLVPFFALKIALHVWGYGPPYNTWFPWPTRVRILNGITIGSATFAGLTVVTDRLTDHATAICSSWLHLASAVVQPKTGKAGYIFLMTEVHVEWSVFVVIMCLPIWQLSFVLWSFIRAYIGDCRVTTLPGKSWTVMEFSETIFQAWKVMENSQGHGKSWKMMMMSWIFFAKMHIIHCLPFTFPGISIRSLISQRHLVSCCMIAYFV